jgi:prepilin-type N-terminal cleavage/methylation domain-containing protein
MMKRGFTLIEVVIVMAIAGLILLFVFLAIAGANQSRRDAQRKADLGRLTAQLEQYASAHGDHYPTIGGGPSDFLGDFKSSYLPDNFNDPSAHGAYDLEDGFGPACNPSAPPASPNGPGSISYDTPGGGSNPFKVRMCLEKGEYDIGT